MKNIMKRFLALTLALVIIVTSDSSVLSVWAGEQITDPAAATAAGAEQAAPLPTSPQQAPAPETGGEGQEVTNPEPTQEVTQEPTQEPVPSPTQEIVPDPAQEPAQSPAPTQEVTQEPSREPAQTPAKEPEKAPEQEAGAASDETGEPENGQEPAAAGSGANLLNSEPTVINFDMGATVSPGELLAGDQFTYEIGYNLTSLPEGQNYQSLSMNIDLNAYKDFLYVDGDGDITVIGADVENYTLRNGQLIVRFPVKAPTGVARTMKIVLKTRNFVLPDKTKIQLNPQIQGKADGKDVEGSIAENKRPTVTIRANDGWGIKKSGAGITSDKDNYYAAYEITLQNQRKNNNGAWEDQDWARYGRLDFAKDGSGQELFSLTDILPANTPAGGGAAAVSVTMRDDSPNSGESTLNEGSDYTVNRNDKGEITSIELKKYMKSTQADADANQMAVADKPKTTVYKVKVAYPKDAYVIPSNEDFDSYELENTAKLKYTLLGQSEDNREAKAVIRLGEKEKDPVKADIKVKKVWSVDGQEYAYNSLTADQDVTFGLFLDEACTKRATNWDKTSTFDTLTGVDKNGEAVFQDVRYGTYYLKETSVPDGYKKAEVIPVTIKKDGTITLGSVTSAVLEDGFVKVTNTAENVGIVRFRKMGLDPEGKKQVLKGAEFTLTRQGEPTPAATAVSDENGLVLFRTIPAGTYTLKETKVSDPDYEVSEKEYTVEVKGGKIADLAAAAGFTQGTDGIPVFTNQSPKGKFRIRKISTEKKDGKEVLLEGAKFVVYGSKNGSTASDLKDADLVTKADKTPYYLVTDENGLGLSIALDEGSYFVKEAEAPEGYQLSSEVKEVTVSKNKIEEISAAFTNEPKIPVIFSKKGILNQASGTDDYKENLAGAVFSVWTSRDTSDTGNLVGYVKTYLDQTGVSVSGIAGKNGSSYELVKGIDGNYQNLILSEGTYYYKEEAAPEGFDLDPAIHDFTLGQDDRSKTIEVLDTTAYGQIEIKKQDAAGRELAGAEFTIYSKESCLDQDIVQKLSLGDQSSAVSRLLPAGIYYIKETKAPNGYVKSREIKKVTVEDKTKISVTVENKRKASLKITKVDSVNDQKFLPGAVFGLYTKAGENSYLPAADVDGKTISAKTTGSDGRVTFENLEPGREYYYHETKAPDGYVPDEGYYPVTLPADTGAAASVEKAVTVENSRMAKLVIEKTGIYDDKEVKLTGVTFKIYKAAADSDTFNLTDCTWVKDVTTSDGKAEADDLEPGIYWLVEQAYAGYETLSPQKVMLTDGMNQAGYPAAPVKLENTPNKGRIRIEKVSVADTSRKLKAVFTIYGSKTEGTETVADTDKTYGTLTTDKDSGTALSGLLNPGTYFLKETGTPAGYVENDSFYPVTVEAGKTNTGYTDAQAIKNIPERKVVIKKYAQFNIAGGTVEYELAGMKFSIYKASGDQEENQKDDLKPENLVYENVEMETYQKELQLAPGAYWFVEDKVTAENAHYHQKIQYFEVDAAKTEDEAKTEIPVEVNNTSSRGLIRVFKEDADSQARLRGAEFELYKLKDGVVSGGSYDADKDHLELVRASGSFGTDADKMVTVGAEGTAYTTPLEPGVYYLKETKAPEDYNIITQWTGPIEVTAGTENRVTIVNKKQVDAVGTKTGQRADGSQAGLKGAAIAAFTSPLDAKEVQDFLEAEDAVFPTDEQVKSEAAFNEYLKANGLSVTAAAVAVSGTNGTFTFKDLSANTDYWLLEVKAPAGYERNTEIYPVRTNQDSGFDTPPTIINKEKGWVEVTKTTELDGKKVLVPNVHFHVYEAVKAPDGTYEDGTDKYKKGVLAAAGYTDSKGIYTSVTLTPERFYIVEEVGPGEEDTCDASGDGAPSAPDYIRYDAPGRLVYVPIGAAKADITFRNTAKNGKISFIKTDAQTGNKLKAVFKVQRLENGSYADYKKNEKVYKISTSTTDITVSDWLEPGTYQLVEESAGTGDNYTLITISGIKVEAGKTTQVTAGDQTGVVANNQKGTFILNKQGWWKNDTDPNNLTEERVTEKLNGVVFKIYKRTAGNTDNITGDVDTSTTPAATASTKNGKITVKLDAGDYWFVETSLGGNSSSYESLGDFDKQLQTAQTNEQYFTIQPGKTVTWEDADSNKFLKNYATGGRIQIKKIDINTKDPLKNVQFGIFKLNGQQAAAMTTGTDGTATSSLLAEGSYYVKEIGTPKGYAQNNRLYGTFVVENNKVTSSTTDNLTYTGTSVTDHPVTNQKIYRIQVTKVNEKDQAVTSARAVFALYKTKEAAENAVNGKNLTDAYKTAETNADGLAVFNDITIEEGKTSQSYYLVESQAPENYELSTEIKEVVVNYSTADQVVPIRFADKKYGKLKITKTASWNWGNPSEEKTDLSGAEFALYKVSGDQAEPKENETAAASLVTGADGVAVSGYLEPGWYKIVETAAPEGFTVKTEADWIEIKLNDKLAAADEIVAEKEIHNEAVKGRFRVYKWDGEKVSGVDPRDSNSGYTPLTGARFVLYKEAAENEGVDLTYQGVDYHKVTGTGTENFEVNGIYVSGMLEKGNYCIVETEAPMHTQGGVTTKFQLDPTPHPFVIAAGTTVNLDVYNSARGSIQLTKTGDADNGSEKITAARFALYRTKKDAEQEQNAIDLNKEGITYTIIDNVYKWTDVNPGTYWIKELASAELDELGYGVNTVPVKVTVEAGRKIREVSAVSETMVDQANKGRILVVKKDADTQTSLPGAEFKLYTLDSATQAETEVQDCTFTDQGDGTYLSTLIPAAKDGTEYILKETKAPDGYSLDPDNKITVKVYPLHKPAYAESQAVNKNVAVLENKAKDQIASFISKIDKEIRNAEDKSYSTTHQVRADESLQLSDYTVDFKLSGYADGTNKVGAEKFVVTDDADTLIPYKAKNETTTEQGDPGEYEAQTWKDGDYHINSVTLLPTSHGDTEQTITADIYVKTSASGNEWTRAYENVVLDQTAPVEKTFAGNSGVMGVQVSYNHVGERFRSDGMVLNITFHQRKSDKEASEIRKITNKARLYWEDLMLNESGEVESRTSSADLLSNEVTALIPAYSYKLPQVSIENTVTTSQNLYYSGQTISYQTTVTNHKLGVTDEADFKDPLVTIQMPAHTGLDQRFGTNGFGVKLAYLDGEGKTRLAKIDADKYILTPITDTKAAVGMEGGAGDYTTMDGVYATSYVLNFKNFTLKAGDKILIDYQGFIDYESKEEIKQLISPAYLSSTYTIPASYENPNGLSFAPYSQKLVTNPVTEEVDKTVDADLEHLNAPTVEIVEDLNQIAIEKVIGVEAGDGESPDEIYNGKKVKWLAKGETAHVNPADAVFYKLIFRNYSDAPVTSAHIIDVLPYGGDHDVLPTGGRDNGYYNSRGTTTPKDAVMEVQSVSGEGEGTPTFYYTDYDWSSGNVAADCGDSGILGGIYSASTPWSGWTQGTAGKPTAIGAEVDFGAKGLETGGSYEIRMEVKTPGFTADKVKDFYNKLMINSAAVSVRRADTQAGELPKSDFTSSNMVACTMDLPTGEIGDYVWYDTNENGVQDEKEIAAEGIKVTLTKETHKSVGGNPFVQKEEFTTTTDAAGKYLFSNLYCNYLENPDITDPADPDRYMGGEYYTYTVTFHKPGEDYGFTKQEVTGEGITKENDSNPDGDGNTSPVVLNVLERDGKLYGESNLTIDAGLIQPYAIGNRVWLDKNNNGIQDDGETGVANVNVLLYQVVEGKTEAAAMKTTKTDENGLYQFTNLQQGQYVVEFDITALVKADKTYQYDFTKALDSAVENDTDSDAEVKTDGQGRELNADGRILRTQVISLNDADLAEQGIRDKYDDRWDAGLVYYSALGGVAFDDTDYDDTHSQMRPLTGTKVELFLVNQGVRQDQPIASAAVLEDGSYYFDHLVFDGDTQEYAVKFTYPEGYRGVKHGVGDDTKDSDADYFENDSRQEGFIKSIPLKKGEISLHNDGGARKYAAIGDYVWNDTGEGNDFKNGLQDDGETPVSGVRVILQSRENPTAKWEFYGETTTDEKGKYLFKDLKSSPDIDTEYRVVFALPRDTRMTSLNAGKNSAIDSDANGAYQRNIADAIASSSTTGGFVTRDIKPGYGETDLTWDAGIVRLYSSVGDYVWYDDDNDGVQDPEEKPVPDIKVVLERSETGASSSEWTAVGETVTDKNGKYLFDHLISGYYRVKFQVPEDYRATRYGQNGNDTGSEYDSDAARRIAEGNWYYTRSFYLADGTVDLTWDAGIYKPVTRTVRKRVTRPTDRTVTRRVARQGADRSRVRRRTRNVKTGDNSSAAGWALICISAMGAAYVIKRKKGTKAQ